ncbi:hypothetical protein TERTU_3109 [Teredinibacter turnerae T7901]|uniref:Uncharacterized protein n=1 Tax=Teredinibacter turnerae (strain ATCC 39867 / T7901) TaxID=377629 RepID=C5BP86_TERTT|nr:hypothetical protein TERTU_3109 [Teredinibacter turnerae T7901]
MLTTPNPSSVAVSIHALARSAKAQIQKLLDEAEFQSTRSRGARNP